MTLLGKCYLEIGANEDSLELLEKAIEVYKTYEHQEIESPIE